MDGRFHSELEAVLTDETPAVLVTIISVKGSTPRKPGAKMVVLADGRTYGTIGGGCGEAEVKREALHVIDKQISQKHLLNMTNEMAEEEGMVCGGIMEVFLDYLGSSGSPERQFLLNYLEAAKAGDEPVLITVVDSGELTFPGPGSKMYVNKQGELIGPQAGEVLEAWAKTQAAESRQGGRAGVARMDGCELLIEPVTRTYRLLILGGGHIALPLATMAKILGYHVTVVDDRISFANSTRFPMADRVICDNFINAIQTATIDGQTIVVIITRGHRHDKACLREVFRYQPYYTGMVGSRRRVKALKEELAGEGIEQDQLGQLYSPIGLKIGAETPEEIAISILAQIICVCRGGQGRD